MAVSPNFASHTDNFDDFEKVDAGSGGSEVFNVSTSHVGQEQDQSSTHGSSQLLIGCTDYVNTSAKSDLPAEVPYAGMTWLNQVDPRVLDLIYWRDIKKTCVVFSSMLILLLSLALFSVLSVLAYLSLAFLTVTVSFRVYKNILGAVQKSGEGHPFKHYLDMDVKLPVEKLHQLADNVAIHVCCMITELRSLFLVENLIDSLKFGFLLWVLTYIGSWFNGMTLIILGLVFVFCVPKVYEVNKMKIDQYLGMVSRNIKKACTQLKEKLPFPAKKEKKQ